MSISWIHDTFENISLINDGVSFEQLGPDPQNSTYGCIAKKRDAKKNDIPHSNLQRFKRIYIVFMAEHTLFNFFLQTPRLPSRHMTPK